MKIRRARVIPLALPLRAPLVTAHGTVSVRRGALLMLDTDEGLTGLGEATPIAGFGLETPARTREALASLGELVLGADPRALDALLDAAERAVPDAPCARAALDSALHDLAAQIASLPLATWLAGHLGAAPRTRIAINALLTGVTTRALAVATEAAVSAGFGCLKLKIGGGSLAEDRERVATVRAAAGSAVRLRLDANGSFPSAEDALRGIERLTRYDLEWIEQPVPARDVSALARVRSGSPVAIAADEAAADAEGLARVLAAHAADWVVLKPSALGGLRAATRAAARAHAAGCGTVVTTLLDGAVARAAALALAAALPGPLPACGLATGALLAADLASAETLEGGALSPGVRPGLGVVLERVLLERVAEGRGRVITRLAGRTGRAGRAGRAA